MEYQSVRLIESKVRSLKEIIQVVELTPAEVEKLNALSA
jgi:hypothetical protein